MRSMNPRIAIAADAALFVFAAQAGTPEQDAEIKAKADLWIQQSKDAEAEARKLTTAAVNAEVQRLQSAQIARNALNPDPFGTSFPADTNRLAGFNNVLSERMKAGDAEAAYD